MDAERHPSGLLLLPYTADDALVAAAREQEEPQAAVRRCPEVAVVLGRGSDPERELQVEACLRDRVPVYRRRGGGCAVVLDRGNLILSAAVPLPGLGRVREAMAHLTDWALAQLAAGGVGGVARREPWDLGRGDRKVGGSSLHRTTGMALYGVTLLVEPEITLIERYLLHPPREPLWRRGRGHRDFLGDLAGAVTDDDAGPIGDRTGVLERRLATVLLPPERI